ncbi:MAG: HAD family hydrolase [Candidatus Hermodarchaeota archaeon]
MKVKAVIFDLGGVVINLDFSNFYNKIIIQSPLNKPQTPIMLEFFRQSDMYHQGTMTDDEFYQLACDLLQVCMLDQSDFFDAFNSIISGYNTDVAEIIKSIRESNQFKLLALSNVNASHWNFILNKGWAFIHWFDELILSHETHLIKPNPEAFEFAIKKAGCKPKQIVYIDDGLNNIRSAKKLGINGIKFTNSDELLNELRKLNIVKE